MPDDSNRTAQNDPRTTVAWHKVYLALTVLSTVLVGVTQVGVPPLDDIGPHAAAALVVALFAIASLAYWYDVRRWRRRNEDELPDFLGSLGEEIPFEEQDANGTGEENGTDGGNGTGDDGGTVVETGTEDENETDDDNGTQNENGARNESGTDEDT